MRAWGLELPAGELHPGEAVWGSLGIPHYEVVGSAKARAGEFATNRWFVRSPDGLFDDWTSDDFVGLLDMPSQMATFLERLLPHADAVHLGQETTSRGRTDKLYVERSDGFSDATDEPDPVGLPTHVGLKWNRRPVSQGVASLYSPLPTEIRSNDIHGRFQEIVPRSAFRALLEVLSGGSSFVDVLSVRDIGGNRASLDFGFIEPVARLGSVSELVVAAFSYLGVGEDIAERWVSDNAGRGVGRLAIGRGNDRQPFLTVYHGVVGARATAAPGRARRPYNGGVIDVKDRYPEFALEGHDGRIVSLHDFSDRWLLLYWYPKADTPGCTAQALGLRDQIEAFEELGCAVVGASFDPPADNRLFHDRHLLPFVLVSDVDRSLAPHVGAGDADSSAARRVAHLVDPDGCVAVCYDVADPEFFAELVLDDLERLQAGHG